MRVEKKSNLFFGNTSNHGKAELNIRKPSDCSLHRTVPKSYSFCWQSRHCFFVILLALVGWWRRNDQMIHMVLEVRNRIVSDDVEVSAQNNI